MSETIKLGLIGAGNMATATCLGIVHIGLLRADDILASDPDESRRRHFATKTGARTTADNLEACKAEVVVLAVKPQVVPTVLAELGPALGPDTLVISIAAGIPTGAIEAASSHPLRVIRAMPNTPMLVGEGAVALCKGAHATDHDLAHAMELFASSATVIEVPEDQMDAVTALSGTGPAYLFFLAEIMVRAGEDLGLSSSHAAALVNKTLFGAGTMLIESGEPAPELRRRVTTPGGTTEAAIRSMQESEVPEHIIAAIRAACRRSGELSQKNA